METRPSWQQYFMEMALLAAKRSTCLRRQVGAILVKDNQILSSGYNGSPKGISHCAEIGCLSPRAAVVGIDLLPVDPIDGVTIFEHDFMDDAAPAMLMDALGGAPDIVLSDMAANTVGHPQTDALRTMALVETAFAFAIEVLAPGGAFVAKVFAGGADSTLVAEMKRHFTTVKHAKPPASRKGSVEWFVVAQGFKGRPEESGSGA